MENVTIVKGRENTLEFDINISGANKKEPAVRFVIEGNPTNYSFQCKRGEKDDWTATIPEISQLKNKAYPFCLEVIVDGYFFEAFRGTVDIIAEPDVKTSNVKHSQPTKPVVKSVSVKKDDTETTVKKETKKKDKATKPKEVKEQTNLENSNIEEIEMVDVQAPVDNFKGMAEKWLSREKPVVTEQEKTVKSIIKNLATNITNTIKTSDVEIPKVEESVEEMVDGILNEITDPEIFEKSIKVQAILKSLK